MAYVLEYVDEYKYDDSIINYAQDSFIVLVDNFLTGILPCKLIIYDSAKKLNYLELSYNKLVKLTFWE